MERHQGRARMERHRYIRMPNKMARRVVWILAALIA